MRKNTCAQTDVYPGLTILFDSMRALMYVESVKEKTVGNFNSDVYLLVNNRERFNRNKQRPFMLIINFVA